jgi:hypothetical protein
MTTSDPDPTTPHDDRLVDAADPEAPPWDAPPGDEGAADDADAEERDQELTEVPEHGEPGLPPAGDDPMGGAAPTG